MKLRRKWVLAAALLIVSITPHPAPAQAPESFEARAEYLLRRMDAGLLPTPMLIAMLRDPYPESRVLALRVVASSSDPSQTLLLAEYLRDRDFRVRYEVMLAAGRLGPEGREIAFRGLHDGIPKVRQAAAWAACHGGPEGLGPLMDLMAKESDLGVRATALANLWRFEDAGWERHAAAAAASTEAQLRRAAAYSLARSGRDASRAALRRLAADGEAVIRATAVTGLGRGPLAKDDIMVLTRALADPDTRVRIAACNTLSRQSEPALGESTASSVAAMWRPTEPQLAVMALRAAAARPEIGGDAALVELMRTEEPWLAAEAFMALARRGADGVDEITGEWMTGSEVWQRRAVASMATELGVVTEKAVVDDPEPAVRLAWVDSLSAEEVPPRLEMLRKLVADDPDPIVRATALNQLSGVGEAGSVDVLLDLVRSWRSDELPDARGAALAAALAATEDNEQRETVVERAIRDADPAVAIMVVNAARSLGLPARSHERELRHNHRWYLELVTWMTGRHWLDVTTDRGSFRIRLESLEAPITTREVFDLAAAGFYDDLTFHRVVPNFVVQGGDPRGDGWGGPGFVLPDEPAYRPFDAWRVGIATSGPNTGGSQLFVTLMPADHLVGHYTNMGEVVAGREVLTRLRAGDRIHRIVASSGDEPPPLDPVLLGSVEWPDLAEIPGWWEEYEATLPVAEAIAALDSAAGVYRIVTVLGSWCEDSRREVPRLIKVLELLTEPVFDHELIGVDRTRRIDDAALAELAGVERTVDRVATIIVFDGDGIEVGRIVETAEKPIEELLVDFIASAEGWSRLRRSR